jgi:hypothetical protein
MCAECRQSDLQTIPSDFFSTVRYVTSLSNCFRLTPIKRVEAGVFDNLQDLEIISNMFDNCTELTFVDKNAFINNKKLKEAKQTFISCTTLGTSEDNSNCILCSDTGSQIFNVEAPLTDISGIFYNCRAISAKDGLTGFFSSLPNLKKAICAF